jgi:hypothetical protein
MKNDKNTRSISIGQNGVSSGSIQRTASTPHGAPRTFPSARSAMRCSGHSNGRSRLTPGLRYHLHLNVFPRKMAYDIFLKKLKVLITK